MASPPTPRMSISVFVQHHEGGLHEAGAPEDTAAVCAAAGEAPRAAACVRGIVNSIRPCGKVSFVELRDPESASVLQVLVGKREVGVERFDDLRSELVVGSMVECCGTAGLSRRGILSLVATSVSMVHAGTVSHTRLDTPKCGGFEVLFRDKQMLVLLKPPDTLVHPAPRQSAGATMTQQLKQVFEHPIHPVHRLDRDVSGAIVFALNKTAAQVLHKTFAPPPPDNSADQQLRRATKLYIALVGGKGAHEKDEWIVDTPLRDVQVAASKRKREKEDKEKERKKKRRNDATSKSKGKKAFISTDDAAKKHLEATEVSGDQLVGTEAAEVSTAVAGALDVDVSAAPLELPSTLPAGFISTTLGLPNREQDWALVRTHLPVWEWGDATATLFDTDGTPIAVGYNRVLMGDHGPYLELSTDHLARIDAKLAHLKPFQERKFFDLLKAGCAIVYKQKLSVNGQPNPPRTGAFWHQNNRVDGYADYHVGMYYVGCDRVQLRAADGFRRIPRAAIAELARARRKKVTVKDGVTETDSAEGRGTMREARTMFTRLAYLPTADLSLLRVRLFTGRTHQIRRHLQQSEMPIVGDKFYGSKKLNKRFQDVYGLPRIFLHAHNVTFQHPVTRKEHNIRAALPQDLALFIQRLPGKDAALCAAALEAEQAIPSPLACASPPCLV